MFNWYGFTLNNNKFKQCMNIMTYNFLNINK